MTLNPMQQHDATQRSVPKGNRRRDKRRSARSGFTLPELVTVLLLTSIFAAVVLPKWAAALQRFRVATAANRIATDLTLVRSAAYNSSTSKTINFSVAASQYTVNGVRALNRASGSYVVSLAEDPYRSSLVSVWGQTSPQSITFDGYGKPNQGGTIVVAAGNEQKSIIVDAGSGAVVVP